MTYNQSTQDLIHKGVDAGSIECLPYSVLQDSDIIKTILKDTLVVRSLYDPYPDVLSVKMLAGVPSARGNHR
jgi:hypothetical protein